MKKPVPTEKEVQKMVCQYLRLRYPDVIFMSDLASGMKLTIGQAKQAAKLRSSRGMPDLFIARIRNTFPPYHGLFIELKRDDIRLKNGGVASYPRIKEQTEILRRLSGEGYKAVFACGFDEAKKIIDEYLR